MCEKTKLWPYCKIIANIDSHCLNEDWLDPEYVMP